MIKRLPGGPEILFVLIGILSLSAVLFTVNFLIPLSHEDLWKEVRIPKGTTYSQGIDILQHEGFTVNKLAFLTLARLTTADRKLGAGHYNLNLSMTPLEVFDTLKKGKIINFTVTFPEGTTLEEIKAHLMEHELINEADCSILTSPEFLDDLNIEAPSLEGYLFPDTYIFAKGTEPEDIFTIMVQRMRSRFTAAMTERAEELGMSERDVLALASIIEKEAIYDRERPIISAVYHNRLKKKMRLQADPTVVYGIKRMQDGITRADLRRKTRYNTYVNYGLPPGPIASPGLKSIQAALYPAAVDFLFFVSKNDGTHYFSKTAREHYLAVLTYQRNKGGKSEKKDDQKEKN